jgi:myo-inositol 2-dehydrogenase/D-chiro-inositol 1-dehydrogenase
MSLRIGVLGTGVMGAEHACLLQNDVPGATVTALYDPDVSRAGAVAERVGAAHLGSVDELINSNAVDAVLVASHDSAHAAQVLACLDAGKPVLCEKPLAPTVAECLRIVQREADLGGSQLVSVGFMRRFHPAFVALKEQMRSGGLGAPLLLLGSHRNVAAYPHGSSEGTITNSAIHDIDSTSWLLNSPITEVSWHGPRPTSQDRSRHDPQLIHLRTADGVLASIDIFVNARYGFDVRQEIVCEQGTVSLNATSNLTVNRDRHSRRTFPADWRPYFAEAYRLELQAWISSITAGQPGALATAVDGLRATEVAQGLITSMRRGGRAIRVSRS